MGLDFLEIPSVEHVEEPQARPAGEYEVEIFAATLGTDVNGNGYVVPKFRISGDFNAKTFTKYIGIPGPDMDEETLARVQRALKVFETWAQLEHGAYTLNEDMLKGKKGSVILKMKGAEEDEYGIQNDIAKFL